MVDELAVEFGQHFGQPGNAQGLRPHADATGAGTGIGRHAIQIDAQGSVHRVSSLSFRIAGPGVDG